MLKKATHDSATGEKSWWPTIILLPFSRTQSKDIKQQLSNGCRYFDIRVRKTFRGWICAHGLWESKRSVEEILEDIDNIGKNEDIYVNITYEGWGTTDFEITVDQWTNKFSNIKFVCINIKYTNGLKWKTLKILNEVPGGAIDQFFKLDFRSWHTFLPIPWLWKKIYGPNPEFNENYFQFVDSFLFLS